MYPFIIVLALSVFVIKMSQIVVQLPLLSPIPIDENLWLVPCAINELGSFVPTLAPAVAQPARHQNWTEEEDRLICEINASQGPKWTQMAQQINQILYYGDNVIQPR